MTSAEIEKTLSTRQAAVILGVTPSTADRFCKDGRLPHTWSGQRRAIRVADVLAFKASTSEESRFLAMVEKTDTCWNWIRAIDDKGYGRFQSGGRRALAHRVSYQLFVAPIPEDLQIDHLCRNRRCVNPAHLEPVTGAENMRRMRGFNGRVLPALLAGRGSETYCANGHLLTEDNVYTRPSRPNAWSCRSCSVDAAKRYRARKRNGAKEDQP